MSEEAERERDFLKACEALRESFQKVNETICRVFIEAFRDAGVFEHELLDLNEQISNIFNEELFNHRSSPYPECDDCHIVIKDYYYTSKKRKLTVCRKCFTIREQKGIGHEGSLK